MTEREQFEAWAKVRYAKNPHFWLRQIDDGGYSCGMADSAWDAWQAARAQPAQAVPVLTDAEIHAADPIPQNRFDQERVEFARRVEQAVRAKLGVAVPMTHMQIVMLWGHRSDGPSTPEIVSFARLVERHHGIVGKEGGNV